MSREALIEKTINNLKKLPEQKLKEVHDFAEFLISKENSELLNKEIQQLVSKSKIYAFLEEDEDIYSVEDLKEKYK
ncbi:MAG: DUF2281 domain-containing protein [Cyclobacteriaceae bacterium]|nr:DUF2281 domain-containing protein [Cyclobacteriaceae bacterium]MCX7636956.1 DUF2281 domain-containing protein [Cyclobacteriaceae bacterium]MDW8330475.1 hypothetical protein [Cyclobacteriaceae bacterium]